MMDLRGKNLNPTLPFLFSAALAWVGCTGTIEESSVARSMRDAEIEHGVPDGLLAAIAWVETGLSHSSEPTEDGGFGIMHLVEREGCTHLSDAAALVGADPDDLKHSLQRNIEASAALLADFARRADDGDGAVSWSEWKLAVARYTGIDSPDDAYARAGEIFAILSDGDAVVGESGEEIIIDAHPELAALGDWRRAFHADNPRATRYASDVIGARLYYPETWRTVEDPYLWDTYGVMLLGPDLDTDDLHGPMPVARIALDYDAEPGSIDAAVDEKISDFPGVDMTRREISVQGRPAIALGPIPGAQISTNIYLQEGERLYRVTYYRGDIDARGSALLEGIEWMAPTQPVEGLPLLRHDDDRARFDETLPDIDELHPEMTGHFTPDPDVADDPRPAAGEYQLSNGCWAQPTGFFIQTAHSWDANGTGWSQMGTPNFWGERTHGNWGYPYGRCTVGLATNDLYAVDYYLRTGDRIYSPFAEGYVTYAGWDPEGWWNYGRMVVIRSPNGKYWSLSAHLRDIYVVPGQYVTRHNLIGRAGSTGYAAPYPHLHQVYYRWAWTSWGRPYGGQGLKPTRLRYLRGGGGVYSNFWKGKWVSW